MSSSTRPPFTWWRTGAASALVVQVPSAFLQTRRVAVVWSSSAMERAGSNEAGACFGRAADSPDEPGI